MNELAVEIKSLRKVFGRGPKAKVAVESLSLQVEKGSSLAIVGESGSGKTTVARCVVGLERPSEGEVIVGGRVYDSRPPNSRERRRRAGQCQMVFQDPYGSLNPMQSVRQILRTAVSIRRSERPSAVSDSDILELLDLVDLPRQLATSRPRQLSGGQRQRVAIARALAAEPQVLVLDEAVAALDVSVQAQILNLLADIRHARPITYLFISHDLRVVRQISDQIVVMHRGRIVESGLTGPVIEKPTHEYTQRLLESVPRVGWNPSRLLSADLRVVDGETS